MTDLPSRDHLVLALTAADTAHEEYERVVLKGIPDDHWSGFYAAYLIGRLGEFVATGRLALLLEEVDDADWVKAAADHVLTKLRS